MSSGTEEKAGLLSRLGLNDNKAGMQNLDREKINQIIYEASKGSKYFENEKKKDKQVDIKIAEQRQKIAHFTAKEMNKAEKEADALLKRLEEKRDLSRTIVHIDMDAFFAAVETRDNPSLLDKPMAVGSNYMLSTSNYIARRFGVRAAMPGFIAKKLCPQLVIVPSNFAQYAAVSKEVKDVLVKYDKHFCPVSFDEAYLDITEHLNHRKTLPKEKRTVICRTCDRLDPRYCSCDPNKSDCESTEHENLSFVQDKETPSADQLCFQEQDRSNLPLIEDPSLVKGLDVKMCPLCKREVPNYREEVFGVSAEEAVREIRRKIEQRTQLTASAGIAANTLLAKICSDRNKPNGQFSLPHITHVIKDFVTDLPIRKVSGIGKVTEKMLQAIDIVTCSQLYEQRSLLYLLYSEISFNHFMSVALGIGSTHVERTFFELSDPAQLYDKCLELSKILASDLQEENFMGRTVSLKIKTVDFEVKTKSQTLTRHTCDEVQIYNVARNLLQLEIQNSMPKPFRLRLMGVRMSNLILSSQFPKKDSIEYFMKKDPSPSDTNLLTEHEKKCQNETVPNECGQAESSSDYLEKGISESPGHYCPICDRKCPKDLRLFNAHIDKCLLQQSGGNDRKTKRASPLVTNADFEDFLEFSTIKTSRKTKKKTKMTQKNLKTVFEETLVRNGIPTDSCLEKSECKSENLSETENILKRRKDCKKTCTKENSSETEQKDSNGVILESCVDSGTLKHHLSSDGVAAEVEEESCLHENKSLSPSVSKLGNSEELLVSGCENPSPECSTATADVSKVSELNDADMEQILTRLHRTKEEPSKVDRIDLVKSCPEYVTDPHSKNSRKQSDCDNTEKGTDCSSADIANSTGLKPFGTNIQTKFKNIQDNKFLKKTLKNCNLLKYFSKSSVNKREEEEEAEEVNQCLGFNESLKWSESTERVVVEKTDGSILDETISSEQEVDAGGLLNNEDITDQQQTVAKTSLGHSVVSDKLQKQVDSGKDISSVTDKLQQEVDSGQINSLDCDKLQQEVETGQDISLVVEKVQQIVETGQVSSLASGKLQKEVDSGQRINLASDKLQKEVDSGQEISLVTKKIQKIKSGRRRSLVSVKLETEVQTGQEINQDSNKVETRADCDQGGSSNVTEQLQKIFNSGQLDSVTSGQSHGSANTGQTDCSIFHSHSMKLFPHSTENSIKTSESMINVETSCNHGDSPNNEVASSCPPQFQGSTGCVSIDTQFHSPAKTTSKLPQDKEFPTERDNGQTTELVHQCPICNKDILITDMSTFNEHVDLCLNQGTIRKILLEQGEELKNSAKHKRPAETPSPDINKRKKSLKHNSTPRIDSYFFSV
ncbi:DNA polymerase kappa-like isoform X2 [Octopus sinensis]|uniref:DNA polymerase kappa n=1 Tax=Octopus sinensis TaxID=2607531 RepID=A0A7E6FE57_9MOLL|nr:DNA polymerase kappa-like isoform X2 [Octopus sinensis]